MSEKYQYYAETLSGYTIKGLVEVLQNCLTDEAFLRLENAGISLCDPDENQTTLINIDLPMENFDNYHCEENRTIAVKIKHLHKLLKNVKKKDSVTLFINKDKYPNKLGIRIVPVTVNKKSERAETSYITIRDVKRKTTSVPEGYHHPKVIASTEYQKMCKKMAVGLGKTISVTIQENYYICFYCDGGDIISSEMTFGTLNLDEDKQNIYEASFFATMLNQLIKMPGLSQKMQISAPKNFIYPLRIKMQAGNLGTIEVYLKTKAQIEHEKERRSKERVKIASK